MKIQITPYLMLNPSNSVRDNSINKNNTLKFTNNTT